MFKLDADACLTLVLKQIVITTFQTLTNEFPADDEELKKRAKQKKKKAKDKFIVDSSEEEREKGSRK